MISQHKLVLAGLVLIALSACSSLNTEIGYMSLKNATKSSIDTWIIDGQTTKAQIRAALGPYQHDNPNMAALTECKPEARVCYYMVNVGSPIRSNSYVKSVAVNYDERNVATSHKFSETRLTN